MSATQRIRIDSIESGIKAAALIFAREQEQEGHRLPKLRFTRRDLVAMAINRPGKRNYGWKPIDIISSLGSEIAADIAELHVLKSFVNESWERAMISFPHERETRSVTECVLSYHDARR